MTKSHLKAKTAKERKQMEKIKSRRKEVIRSTLLLRDLLLQRQMVGLNATRPVAASVAQRKRRQAARSGQRPYEIRLAAENENEAEVLLYGAIGEDFWGEGNDAKSFHEELNNLKNVETIHLRINSGGGDVFDGTSIYNSLVDHPAKVIVHIVGVAASAATLISMAGDEIRMAENAHYMIHRASGMVWGNANDIRAYLELLDRADNLIMLTYEARTGIDRETLEDLMDADRWMTAEEAKEHGFIDFIVEAKKVTPDITPEDSTESIQAKLDPSRVEMAKDILHSLSAHVEPVPAPQPTVPQPVQDDVTDESMEKYEMNEHLRKLCVAAGMSESLTDDEANAWLNDNFSKVFGASTPEPTPEPTPVAQTEPQDVVGLVNAALDARERRDREARDTRAKHVDSCLKLVFDSVEEAPAGLRAECLELDSDEAISDRIQSARKAAQTSPSGGPRVTYADKQPRDNHIAALGTALSLRCLESQNRDVEKLLPSEKRAKGWQDFEGAPLLEVARQCLLADGMSYNDLYRLNDTQIAQAAIAGPQRVGITNAAVMTTGSLSIITQDAFNKSLLGGYEEAPSTWRGPGRQAESVRDFKTIHRTKLSGAPNLPVWNDNTRPTQAKLANEEESYAIEAYAEEISFSWRLVINDDLEALSRRPAILGNAAKRTVNAHFWSVVTSNPVMSDGAALFAAAAGNRKQANLISSGSGAPTATRVGALKKLMRLMRGLNTPENNESDDILNITPKYIVVPAALEQIVLELVRSSANPADNKSSAVYNTASTLTPVIEPLLDANSATAWYLFADPNQVDTVEVTFLRGQETPMSHNYINDQTLSQHFVVVQSFAAKAIDHRGVAKDLGTS